jgi:hypothetical protein
MNPIGSTGLFDGLPGDLALIFIVPVVVAAILILAAGRKEDDANRTQMRYVGTIGIVTLFIALFAFYRIVSALSSFIIARNSDLDNTYTKSATDGALLLIAAGAVFVYHKRRAKALSPAGGFAKTGTGAAARATLYGVCFVAALIALFSAVRGVQGLLELIAPTIFGHVDGARIVVRTSGISEFVTFGALATASVLIFLRSWNWLPEHK